MTNTNTEAVEAGKYLMSIDDMERLTDERGRPFLSYSAHHVANAFKAGAALSLSTAKTEPSAAGLEDGPLPIEFYHWLRTIEKDVRVWDLTPSEVRKLRATLSAPTRERELLREARDGLNAAGRHIEHMAAFIGKQKVGYSFEALGEDSWQWSEYITGRIDALLNEGSGHE